MDDLEENGWFIRENPIKINDLGENGWFIMENPTKTDDFFYISVDQLYFS